MKMKLPYNIRKSFFKVLPMALLMGAPAMNSCKPDEPKPQITCSLTWNWNENLENAPTEEMVRFLADDKYTSEVHLMVSPTSVPSFTAATFHSARDTLQRLINVNPDKVRGYGNIYTNSTNGASLPFIDGSWYGMALEDSIWFAQNGWGINR
jgi:hypothetical protein